MYGYLIPLLSVLLVTGCQRQEKNAVADDLNSIKKNFLLSILESQVEEGPFHMNYSLRTVFFSPDIVSLFGEIHVYDHLPHGWWRYEAKTLYRVQGKLKEVELWDLFTTAEQREFLRKYCENSLKVDSFSYFSGENPLRTKLEYEDMRTFVIDDKFLIVFFQPYTVSGLGDGPPQVKIPYEHLRDHWNNAHPFPEILQKTLSFKSYITSWDGDWDSQNELAFQN
jgi:hypothetical protein